MSPQIDIDFSQVEEFEPLPAGQVSILIEEVTLKQSKSGEYPYLNWELRVSEGEFANRRLFMMTSLSERALWRLKAVFENIGVLATQMQLQVDETTNLLLSPALSGLPAIAVVSQEVYEGRIQNRVEDLQAIPGGSKVILGKPAMTIGGTKPAAKPPRMVLK